MKLAILACVLLAACAPQRMRVGIDHVSHPLVGWPFSPASDEDAITEARVALEWQRGCAYFAAGVGVNLYGRNGSGFYGPPLTGNVSTGCVFNLRGGK